MFRFTNHNSHFFKFILTNKNDKKLTIQKLVVNTNKRGLALGIYLQNTFNLDKSPHNVEGTMHSHTKTHTMWLVLIFGNQHTWKNNLES
jgi:hypothetical protein